MKTRRTLAVGVAVGALLAGAQQPASAGHDDYHWPDRTGEVADVDIVDFTGAEWPVGTVVSRWNSDLGAGREINLHWRSCVLTDCVVIEDYVEADAAYPECRSTPTFTVFGCTALDLVNGHIDYAYAYVNDDTNNTAQQRRKTTCHEIGHVIGLGDLTSGTTSCMRQGASPPISQYPNTHDVNAVTSIYNHNG